ncbi:MAG: FadR/GntR family transcriptional regulator [Aeromicrobium sp.]
MIDWAGLTPAPHSAPQDISARLLGLIQTGALAPGTRLPPERELSEYLHVSRATIREALRELELRGMVDRRRGRGTVIVEAPHSSFAASLLGDLTPNARAIREVMDLRAVVEPPIAERAAQRANSAQIAELRDLVETAVRETRDGVAPERYISLDIAFHTCLARMTQNPMLEQLLTVTNEWMSPSRQTVLQTDRRIRRSLAAHRLILYAVEARDSAAAKAEMSTHLEEILELIVQDDSVTFNRSADSPNHDRTEGTQ